MQKASKTKGAKIKVTAKWMGQWFCKNPKVVESMYTKGIKGIKSVIKTRKENSNMEKVTGPELEKTANVVFIDLLKSNKKFIAESTKTIEDPGKIFRKPITHSF